MVPTNSLSIFLKKNNTEFRSLCVALCEQYSYPGSPDDIIQDLYLKFITSDIIEKFDPYHKDYGTKMTTYLFPIVKNFIISKIKSSECRLLRKSVKKYTPSFSEDFDEIEAALYRNILAPDYVDILTFNQSTDSVLGLGSDLKAFKRALIRNRKNKKFMKKQSRKNDFLNELKTELSDLKQKEINSDDPEFREIHERITKVQASAGCYLTDIFSLLYRGYTGKQIAQVYGVSDMSVTNVKHKLAKALYNFGLKPLGEKSIGRNKMPKLPQRSGNRG